MVRFENVKKIYGNINVIDNFNLEIKEGQFVVLIGPSGCGKTTTLKMVNRLIEPTSGAIYINGEDIGRINPVELRRKIGYVIQQIGLFPNMTIAQNVEIVPKLLGWPAEKRKARTEELLNMVDMNPELYAHRYPSELSGGQQQRIGVLRALAAEPPLVLMDEPFGALDPITRESLQDEVKRLQKKLRKTILFVTHDMDEALKIADLIILMKDGKIVQAGSPEELLSRPANDFVVQFIGKQRLSTNAEIEKVEDVMRPNPVTVLRNAGTAESVELMRRKGVNTLLVVDDDGCLEGAVTIEKIGRFGKGGHKIEELIDTNIETIFTGANSREAFEILLNKKLDYIAVIDESRKLKGLVTKTSMVKALAEVVWKDIQYERVI